MKSGRAQRKRLDVLLVERGLTHSREKAQAIILAGAVRVDGRRVDKASSLESVGADIKCDESLPFVSRGGYKLAHALDRFPVEVQGTNALDAGASTGGFTDVLLQRGAARVYAVDVGYGQLDWRLRTDKRVVVLERTNVRYLRELPERVDLVTADLSFISLTTVMVCLIGLASDSADYVLLIKPQFEAGRAQVGKGGVVRDPQVHRSVLVTVSRHASALGLQLHGLTASPILGPAGNVEFVGWYSRRPSGAIDPDVLVTSALAEASGLTAKVGGNAP